MPNANFKSKRKLVLLLDYELTRYVLFNYSEKRARKRNYCTWLNIFCNTDILSRNSRTF